MPIAWINNSTVTASDFNQIDSYITNAMSRSNIPGMALSIAQGEEIIYQKGYGNAGNGRTVTPDTPFYIGSQSKSFTALAIMQLVEQGKLDLDMPVQTYLPWFRVADEQASSQITIRHLLQHTSGLSESGYVANLPPDATLEMLVRDLSRARLTAPVGSKMQYFNPGYSILGLLIETVSSQSYGDYINEHIFMPLKMTHSFTDREAAEAAGLSQGYGQVFMFAIPLEQPVVEYDIPAGYIISSANDMARYMMAMGNGGELDGVKLLEPNNIQMMFTPNSAINSTYGFGWYISEYYGETKITHGGDTERFHTNVLLLPEKKLSLVLLFNENHMLKDFNEYNTIFWSVASMLTDHPLPAQGQSSILYGWGLFAVWILVLGLAVRKIVRLPQWRSKMVSWSTSQRRRDILKHLLWITISILVVVVIGPALLQRGFSWKWFTGSLPEVAIIVGTLVLDDLTQIIFKLSWMARYKAR
jgi:CubicO group peptidase (beta-lactamase class C family)